MVTRFYLPSTGYAANLAVPFTHGSSWGETGSADRIRCVTTRISSAFTNKVVNMVGTAGTRSLFRQYVSDPIAAQTIAAGTVKGTIRAIESAANDNIDRISMKIVVVSNDGATLRGTVLALGEYVASTEFATTLTNRRPADGDATTQVISQDGDRIVIELGCTCSAGGATVIGTLEFGDNNASDLADNETGTTQLNPFVELSQTVTFASTTFGQAPLGSLGLLRIGN